MRSSVVVSSWRNNRRSHLLRATSAALVSIALFACRPSERKPVEKTQYALDIEQICHAEERSGALAQDPSVRSVSVASWLAVNLVTDESRAFLGRLAAMPPAEKAATLGAEAVKQGVDPCPMVTVWSGK